MEPIIGEAEPGPAAADLVKESSEATFMQDVIDASQETPVIVDFWAPWCGPCKQLGPILEKVVTEARGAVKMVKINVDENQQIAQQLRIQSIPAVYAFSGGRPVDAFQGALPESQVKQFVDKLIEEAGTKQSSPIEDALAQAKEMMDAGDTESALSIYAQVIEHEPENAAAMAGMARALVTAGDTAKAREVLSNVPNDLRDDSEVAAAWSALELAEKAAEAGDLGDLREKVAANENDHQARFDLAVALYAGGDAEHAIDELIEIVRRDRTWNDDAARKEILKIFETLDPAHEVTVAGRRKLSAVLFS